MQNRFENFTIGVLKLNKLVQRIKLLEMDDYGLKAIHVMCIYYAACRPVTAGELARLTLEDKAAISRALSLLKQNGYLQLVVKFPYLSWIQSYLRLDDLQLEPMNRYLKVQRYDFGDLMPAYHVRN